MNLPHIPRLETMFGIRGLMAVRPAASKPLNELVDVLLRQPNSLTPAERELIAAYVPSENNCYYCQTIHGAIAAHELAGNEELMRHVKRDFGTAAAGWKTCDDRGCRTGARRGSH